jgi:hypothetical protein
MSGLTVCPRSWSLSYKRVPKLELGHAMNLDWDRRDQFT